MNKQTMKLSLVSSLLLSTVVLSQHAHAEEVAPVTEVPVATQTLPSAEVQPATEEATPVAEAVASSEAGTEEVTILHTNDIHGRIVEERGVIGMAKLAGIVNEERAKDNQTTLVLDAGDAFQGLPISNSTKGEDMAKLMNEVGYDAMAVGNHEFDFSLEQAEKYKQLLHFPLLSANTYVNGARLFQASTIIDKDASRVGDEFVVIGVTTPETSTKTHPRNVQGVIFADPITEVNQVIEEVEARAKAEGKTYNRYIILAHLGIDTTTPVEWRGSTLAQALSENAHLAGKTVIVIDGHSHTVESATYGHVVYNQTGNYLNNVGKITLKGDQVLAGVITAKDAAAVTPDAKVLALVNDIKATYQAENAVVVLENSPVELNGDRSNVRVRETNLGNVVADALYHYGQTGFAQPTDLAVTNGGGLRATIAKDKPITKGDIIAVLPFGNSISQIQVSGSQIQAMFAKSLGAIAQVDKASGQPVLDEQDLPLLEANGGFLQVSGARVYYDTSLPAGERILSIAIFNRETGQYDALDVQKTYYLATNDFLAAGGDGYTMLGGARQEGPSMDSVFADFLPTASLLDYALVNPNSRLIAIRQAAYQDWLKQQEQENKSQDKPVDNEPRSNQGQTGQQSQKAPQPAGASGGTAKASLPSTGSQEALFAPLGLLLLAAATLGRKKKEEML